jgi:hypothetical protein
VLIWLWVGRNGRWLVAGGKVLSACNPTSALHPVPVLPRRSPLSPPQSSACLRTRNWSRKRPRRRWGGPRPRQVRHPRPLQMLHSCRSLPNIAVTCMWICCFWFAPPPARDSPRLTPRWQTNTHTHTHTHAPGTHHAGWPGAGRIDYRSVSAIYRPGLPPVLRDLTFTLEVRCLSFVLVLCLLGGVDWVFLVCVCVFVCVDGSRISAFCALPRPPPRRWQQCNQLSAPPAFLPPPRAASAAAWWAAPVPARAPSC